MKIFNKTYFVVLTAAVLMSSCAELDEEVEAGVEVEKPVSVIVGEKVSSYDVLKTYSGDLILGSNASLDDISSGSLSSLLMTNFEQVTPSSELTSEVFLTEDGRYDFLAAYNYVSAAQEKGLSVYGDAIISNFNQNDTYLNSFVAPYVYLTPLFPNMVKPTPLNDGSFTGWNVTGDVSIEDYLGHASIKMVNGTSEASYDATSIQSPVYTVAEGAKFELTFYVLSNKSGEGRVTFTGLNNNEPEFDWLGSGITGATFTTKIGWNRIQIQTDDFDGSGAFSFNIELGKTPDVSYFLNIQGLSVVNLNGSVDNPDEIFLECEDAQEKGQWMFVESGSTTAVSGGEYINGTIDGVSSNNHVATGLPSDASNQDYQFTYTFNVNTAGTYYLWLRHKCEVANGTDDSWYISIDGGTYFYHNGIEFQNDSEWQWSKHNYSTGDAFQFDAGEHSVSFKIREGGHLFDKIYLTMTSNRPTGLGSAAIAQEEVTLDVSDEEKQSAANSALSECITNVLTSLGDRISDWTVVKNPFAADGSVAVSGGVSEEGAFFWADYLGEDYISMAFSLARENASAGAKLFISETDLNSNADKLNAVISYANTIADIDGIAVNLSLYMDSDLEAVGSMLEDLAATGKLIYITNLYVKTPIGSDVKIIPDPLLSEIYKGVLDLYVSKVPVSQQYGISLSSPVGDNGLWNAGFNRKEAFMGFAIGLGAQE